MALAIKRSSLQASSICLASLKSIGLLCMHRLCESSLQLETEGAGIEEAGWQGNIIVISTD